jgi:hypothetical protein
LTTAALSVGNHTITAIFNANVRFAGSSGLLLTQAVSLLTPTTTTLTATQNGFVFAGTPVTFTATVAPTAAPGTVAFLVNGAVQQVGPVTNGVATFTTALQQFGDNTIQADFTSSSPNFGNSPSNLVTENVTI